MILSGDVAHNYAGCPDYPAEDASIDKWKTENNNRGQIEIYI
jgi:hypothetical protein